ncbi:MAG: flippase-like domain-containing protein [Candidatus Delongbacteria bacterium]|nr:flippase-like domain-containing protein [Candidatus Delongbacteria bacterium]
MKKILFYILFTIILLYFIFNTNIDFSVLSRLSILDFIYYSLIILSTVLLTAISVKLNFYLYGIKEKFITLYHFTTASMLLNYMPGKAGIISLVSYLKIKHKLPINKYIFVFILNYTIVTIVTFIMFFAFLFDDRIFMIYEKFEFFKLLTIVAIVIIFAFTGVYFTSRFKDIKVLNYFHIFISHINLVKLHFSKILQLSFVIFLGIVLFSVRMYFSFSYAGLNITFFDSLIVGLIANLSFFLSFTPGGLGIKESMIGGISYVLFGNAEVGILASLIDRGMMILWTVVLGSFSIKKLDQKIRREVKKID